MGASRWSKVSAKEAYKSDNDEPLKADKVEEDKRKFVAEEYAERLREAREEVQRKKDKKEKDEKNRSPDSVRAHINALREKLDKGFYGHTEPQHFRKTSIIGTTGRVR